MGQKIYQSSRLSSWPEGSEVSVMAAVDGDAVSIEWQRTDRAALGALPIQVTIKREEFEGIARALAAVH